MIKLYLIILISLGVGSLALASMNEIKQNILLSYGCPQNTFVCKAMKENMSRDSNTCMVLPNNLDDLGPYIQKENPKLNTMSIIDSIRYLGPVRGKYSYGLRKIGPNKFAITAEIFFKNLVEYNSQEIAAFKQKIKRATEIWNQNNPLGDIYTFDFKIAEKFRSDLVSAQLVRFNTSGPYFDKWNYRWTANTIAHEFGHILGLYDEYEYLHQSSQSQDCSPGSIMCNSRGRPQDYHYQFIIQRAFCEV